MQVTTRQGTVLTVQLVALDRVAGGHPEPVVEFRYKGGILCSSYYVSTFSAIAAGVCLQGGRDCRQDLDAPAVVAVNRYIREILR